MKNLTGITFTSKVRKDLREEEQTKKLKLKGVSKEEKDLLSTLKILLPRGTRIVENDRSILGGKEIDILIPSYSLGIEYDGLYFHSEKDGKGPEYHYNKTLQCNSKGIRLVHIFSDEWENRRTQVIYKLKQITGRLDRVEEIASVKETTIAKALSFFKSYSINNPYKLTDEICYGAYNKDGIMIACATFRKDGLAWYIDNFDVRSGSYVENALKNIVSTFVKEKRAIRVLIKTDDRWDDFREYEPEGFVCVRKLPPEYTLTNTYNHRILQETFDGYYKDRLVPKSKEELLKINGYHKVWDCGHTLMEYRGE